MGTHAKTLESSKMPLYIPAVNKGGPLLADTGLSTVGPPTGGFRFGVRRLK